jgi:exodeoxyribonuclease VII small subunit
MTPAQTDAVRQPFEEALAELEAAVRDLEDGEVTLEEALARYETGVSLLKACYAQLRNVEQRILLLTGEDANGKPVYQPFDPLPNESADLRRRNKKSDTP